MLEKFELLTNLSAEQLQEIENICDLRAYRQGEYIIQEGEYTDDIYFLVSGKVELSKLEPNTQKNIQFKEMFPGQSFGEMSFVDGRPRSCSVKSKTESHIYVLAKHKLIEKVAGGQEIISILGATINYQVNQYLRFLSDRHIMTLQERIEELRDRNNFGYFFVALIVMLFLSTIVDVGIKEWFPDYNVYSQFFSWTFFIAAFLFPWLVAVRKMKISIKEVGVTTKKLKLSILDGVAFSCWGVIIIFALAVLVDWLIPGNNLTEKILQVTFPLSSLLYLVHSAIQEFLRAVIQISIQRFSLDVKGRYSIAISAVIFGMCHAHYGIAAILITVVASVIFGAIYTRTYNLVGVSLFHWILGWVLLNVGML